MPDWEMPDFRLLFHDFLMLLAPRAPSKLLPLEIVTTIYSSSAIALVSFAKATATEHEGGRYQIGRCQNPDARFILAVSYS
jgi:hypothetical protein